MYILTSFSIIITVLIAQLVPMLEIFISLVGSLCANTLALVAPPLIELLLAWGSPEGASTSLIVKNMCILFIAIIGFSTGTYSSISALVKEINRSHS